MTEQALQQALNETTDFLQRQRLLKQLWKLRRQQEAEAAPETAAEPEVVAEAAAEEEVKEKE